MRRNPQTNTCPGCGASCDGAQCWSCRYPAGPVPSPTLEEILARGLRSGSGCLIWPGAVDGRGYPHIGRAREGKRRDWIVHRHVFELVNGLGSARGKDVHHRCENRYCVEPSHLEAVTRREHQGRGGRHPDHTRAALAARGFR